MFSLAIIQILLPILSAFSMLCGHMVKINMNYSWEYSWCYTFGWRKMLILLVSITYLRWQIKL